jgi:hypothetical protein
VEPVAQPRRHRRRDEEHRRVTGGQRRLADVDVVTLVAVVDLEPQDAPGRRERRHDLIARRRVELDRRRRRLHGQQILRVDDERARAHGEHRRIDAIVLAVVRRDQHLEPIERARAHRHDRVAGELELGRQQVPRFGADRPRDEEPKALHRARQPVAHAQPTRELVRDDLDPRARRRCRRRGCRLRGRAAARRHQPEQGDAIPTHLA